MSAAAADMTIFFMLIYTLQRNICMQKYNKFRTKHLLCGSYFITANNR